MGYRLRGGTFDVKIEVYISNGKGTPIQDINHKNDILSRDENAVIQVETATFAYWNYDLKCQIDLEATTIDQSTSLHYINPIKKRRLKLKYLLRAWTLTEDDNEVIKIEFDPAQNCMSEKFYHDNIIGQNPLDPVILDAFVSRADMVLEWGMSAEEVNTPYPK